MFLQIPQTALKAFSEELAMINTTQPSLMRVQYNKDQSSNTSFQSDWQKSCQAKSPTYVQTAWVNRDIFWVYMPLS